MFLVSTLVGKGKEARWGRERSWGFWSWDGPSEILWQGGQTFIWVSQYSSVLHANCPRNMWPWGVYLELSSWLQPRQFLERAKWGPPPTELPEALGTSPSLLKGDLSTASHHLLHMDPSSLLWVSVKSIIWVLILAMVALVFLYRRNSMVATLLGRYRD